MRGREGREEMGRGEERGGGRDGRKVPGSGLTWSDQGRLEE